MRYGGPIREGSSDALWSLLSCLQGFSIPYSSTSRGFQCPQECRTVTVCDSLGSSFAHTVCVNRLDSSKSQYFHHLLHLMPVPKYRACYGRVVSSAKIKSAGRSALQMHVVSTDWSCTSPKRAFRSSRYPQSIIMCVIKGPGYTCAGTYVWKYRCMSFTLI